MTVEEETRRDDEPEEEETLQTEPLTAAGEEIPKPYEGVPVLLMGPAAVVIKEQPEYPMEIAAPPEPVEVNPEIEDGQTAEERGEGDEPVINPLEAGSDIPSDEELDGMLKSDVVSLANDLGIDTVGMSKAEVISALKARR